MAASVAGVIETDPAAPLHERLWMVQHEIDSLMDDLHPEAVVVERVFFQVNARTAMSVGQVSGLALAAAAKFGCDVVQYTPNEVKQAVVGYGAASKDQVQRMVAATLGLEIVPRPADVADALALAVCHLASSSFHRAVRTAVGGTSETYGMTVGSNMKEGGRT
jgi:crossover junction endodeoxyribonuclease RuvC